MITIPKVPLNSTIPLRSSSNPIYTSTGYTSPDTARFHLPSLFKLGESINALKDDYDLMYKDVVEINAHKEESEFRFQQQMTEMMLIHKHVYELEQTHASMKARYEDEIARLREKLGMSVNRPDDISFSPSILPFLPTPLSHPPQLGSRSPPASEEISPFSFDPSALFHINSQLSKDMFSLETCACLELPAVVSCVTYSSDGSQLAIGSNRIVNVYDVSTDIPKLLFTFTEPVAHDLYIRTVQFSPNKTLLATGTEDRKIRIWDLNTGVITHTLLGHEQDIYCLAFSKDGKLLASGSGDHLIKLWEPETGTFLCNLLSDESVSINTDIGMTCLALSTDSQYLIAGSLDKYIRVWNIKTGSCLEKLAGHTDSVYSISFAANSSFFVSGSLDGSIRVWQFGKCSDESISTTCIQVLQGHKDFVLSVVISSDSKLILSGSKDRCLQIWGPNECKNKQIDHSEAQIVWKSYATIQAHENSIIAICMNPLVSSKGDDLTYQFVSGAGDWKAKLWKFCVKSEKRTLLKLKKLKQSPK